MWNASKGRGIVCLEARVLMEHRLNQWTRQLTKMRLTTTFALAAGIAVAEAGKCPFGFGGSDDKKNDSKLAEVSEGRGGPYGQGYKKITYLGELWQCPVQPVDKTYHLTKCDYKNIVSQVWEHFDTFENNEYFDKARFAGCLLRTVGHDAMDFRPHAE